jgi:hypothetical protein
LQPHANELGVLGRLANDLDIPATGSNLQDICSLRVAYGEQNAVLELIAKPASTSPSVWESSSSACS